MCMRYDPATGRYGLRVVRVLQAGAVATVLALSFLILRLRRRKETA